MPAGKLLQHVAFDEHGTVDDGYGGVIDAYQEQFRCRAGYVRLRGSESVLAARLEGCQPTVIRVRVSDNTARVNTDWRIRDVRSGEAFNIRSIIMTDDRLFFDITAESGVAT